MKKKKSTDKVVNRRAHFDYHLGDKLEVGMVLSGPEVRAIRDGHAQLKGTYITIRRGELYLLNLTLGSDNIPEIKLLATKRQIKSLLEAKQQGSTIVPVELLPKKRYIKLIIATATGKKTYDKRETIKKRDLEREARR